MQNMARGISSIVTTAVVAGAIGFGAGVYFVPNEKADQFRALVQAWRDLVHSDKANPDSHPSESSQTKAPAETSRTEAQPDIPGESRQLHKVSLIVMLPLRAVRRLNTKTISHHMHRTPVLLELCRRTAHQTSKVSPLRLSPQKLLKTSEVKPKSSSKN
jgi:hypothetical protein